MGEDALGSCVYGSWGHLMIQQSGWHRSCCLQACVPRCAAFVYRGHERDGATGCVNQMRSTAMAGPGLVRWLLPVEWLLSD